MYYKVFTDKYMQNNPGYNSDVLGMAAKAYDCLLAGQRYSDDMQLLKAIAALEKTALEYNEDKLMLAKVLNSDYDSYTTPECAREVYYEFLKRGNINARDMMLQSYVYYDTEANKAFNDDKYRSQAEACRTALFCALMLEQSIVEIETMEISEQRELVRIYLEEHPGIKNRDVSGFDDPDMLVPLAIKMNDRRKNRHK